jgi:hypothetical protein
MMNNFMPSNLPHAFYNAQGGGGNNGSNYSYEINLNAVNKSLNNNAASSSGVPQRSTSNDYENSQKSIYKQKQGH